MTEKGRFGLRFVHLVKYQSGDIIKEVEVDGVCSTIGGEQKYKQGFGG